MAIKDRLRHLEALAASRASRRDGRALEKALSRLSTEDLRVLEAAVEEALRAGEISAIVEDFLKQAELRGG